MESTHRVMFGDAKKLIALEKGSVELVVTSPPYPMIKMWDETFSKQNPKINAALRDGNTAFELMHKELDRVWDQVYRVLRPGGFACINIGDAVRTIAGHFRLYSNHTRILNHMIKIGFTNLPPVIWRKQTNAPNKFMGSGMLPAGAYVTLEHEFILILRKGNKREFLTPAAKLERAQSALFWEERNVWFSDIWLNLKGARQKLTDNEIRKRSGAYPLELAYRMINMYSQKGDTVLDPFLGTGTTTLAAAFSNRNSIGIEIDQGFKTVIFNLLTENLVENGNTHIKERLDNHLKFVQEREQVKGENIFKHRNERYNFPVITKQEVKLVLDCLESFKKIGKNTIKVQYKDIC